MISQEDFMRILRLAIDTQGLSDGDFLKIFAPLDRIRDRRGFVNYREFQRQILQI